MLTAIPEALLIECLGFFAPHEIANLGTINKIIYSVVFMDAVWRTIYYGKFKLNKNLPPTLSSRDVTTHRFYAAFVERTKDPLIGDTVQVAWLGRFRLETDDVFHGLAWWSAEIFDKSSDKGYKIHYPGWEHRWDEWVPRERIRWEGEATRQRTAERINVGDSVEILCPGSRVPGAWLETRVIRVSITSALWWHLG